MSITKTVSFLLGLILLLAPGVSSAPQSARAYVSAPQYSAEAVPDEPAPSEGAEKQAEKRDFFSGFAEFLGVTRSEAVIITIIISAVFTAGIIYELIKDIKKNKGKV